MDVIDEHQGYRIGLIHVPYSDPPYDEGSTPIVRFAIGLWKGTFDVEQVTSGTTHTVNERILDAMDTFGGAEDNERALFERYMRIFHGSRSFQWASTDEWQYVTFDTQAWRDQVGITEEYLQRQREVHGVDPEGSGFANMDEYLAWCEGEVYGWAIERKQRWLPVDDDDEITSLTDMTTWEEEDSCYGYYGHDVAMGAAEQAFNDFLKTRGIER